MGKGADADTCARERLTPSCELADVKVAVVGSWG